MVSKYNNFMKKGIAYGIGILGLLFAAIGFLFAYLEIPKFGMILFFTGWGIGVLGLILDRVIRLNEQKKRGN